MFSKRGMGFCRNGECQEYGKSVFLLNPGDNFHCSRCNTLGHVELERGEKENDRETFREVRVHFNYGALADPDTGERRHDFRNMAIVCDEALPTDGTNVYHLYSPMLNTVTPALKAAEACLSSLNYYRGILSDGEVPRTTEFTLSLDTSDREFSYRLRELASEWEKSGLLQEETQSRGEKV